jgi:hypothetical protein
MTHFGRVAALLLLGAVLLFGAGGIAYGAEVVAQEDGESDNLKFLAAAFAVAWFGFFVYSLLVTRREHQLRREVELLRRELQEREKGSH